MRKLLIALMIFLFASSAWCGPSMTMIAGGGVGASCIDTTCDGFLVCQNFEGTGYDNSESWDEDAAGGTVDEDDTTSPVGKGLQSLKMVRDSGNVSASTTFASSSEVYYHLKYKLTDATPSFYVSFLSANSGTIYAGVNTDGTVNVSDGTRTATTVGTISADTWTHIWVHYLKGTGANAQYSIGFSTDTTEPTSGDNYASVSNGVLTSNLTDLILTGHYSGGPYYFDQVLARATQIGNVCPSD